MMPIKGTQITSAVCRALREAYGNIPIYKEPIDQDFEEPCFIVWCEKTETAPVIWPRFRETHDIEVRYYPPERNRQHGSGLDMGAELFKVLSRITIKDGEKESLPIWATDYSRRIVNDAIVISITYKTEGFFYEVEGESMGGLSTNMTTTKE